jgi:gliding motility-associated-like protein
MKHLNYFAPLLLIFSLFISTESFACHPLPLLNFNQFQYTPGVGLQITADSDPLTWGCDEYWLDIEFRCQGNTFDGSGLSAGVWDTTVCFPFFQSAQVLKPVQALMTYPWSTIPDSILCPGMTYEYRMRENHNFQVGPWTPVMSFTMPGVLDTNLGSLNLTANPNFFCAGTQLGWNWTPGSGCGTSGCGSADTSYQWYVISGEPINVPVNFSCDTCPYPTASPSITTTYGLTIGVGDSNACGYGVYTMIPVTVTPLPYPIDGSLGIAADCNGNVDLNITGYQGDLQWQSSTGSGPWINISGAVFDTLSQSNTSPGDCFRLEISTACATIFSDTICMSQFSPTVGGAVSYTADCQGNVSLLLNGHQGNIQWQSSIASGPWTDISGAAMDTLTQAGIVTGDCFRVKLESACDTSYSDTICPIIPVNSITGVINYTADCEGNVYFWLTGAQGDIQWQSSIASGPWNNISGATSDSLSQAGINTGDCFRVQISTVCDTILTDTVCPTMFLGPTAAFTNGTPGNSQSNVPVSFTDNSTGNIVTWLWNFGGGNPGNNTGIPNPVHTYHAPGSYTVTLIVTDANGCIDSVSLIIQIDSTYDGPPSIVIPNVISPNGDGENDMLVFKNLEQYDGNILKIFNRWGTSVYEQIDYNNNWNGGEATAGTYFYMLDVKVPDKDDIETYKGSITIIR